MTLRGSSSDWKPVEGAGPCRKCGVVGRIDCATWESSCGGFEDKHYRCDSCDNDWWVEGSAA